ncbi:MAG: hypothetical protein ACM3S1_06060 [Hyphomicrobiales bacterium]
MKRTDVPPPARERRSGRWAVGLRRMGRPPGVSKEDAPNVEGREALGPPSGFGQLWEKRYRAPISADISALDLMAFWKGHFEEMWPPDHRYFRGVAGLDPGEVSAIDIPVPGGTRLSSGVAVLHTGETSFTLVTARGHMFAGWITFSVEADPGALTAQVLVNMRASDPLYELGLRFGGHDREDWFWSYTLRELAHHFGEHPHVAVRRRLEDRHRRWSAITNVWYNAWARTLVHRATRPVRQLPGAFRRRD